MSNQALVSYSHKLCATIVLAYLKGKTPLYIKGVVTGLVFIFAFGRVQMTFLHQIWQHAGMRALCSHLFNEFNARSMSCVDASLVIWPCCQFVDNNL